MLSRSRKKTTNYGFHRRFLNCFPSCASESNIKIEQVHLLKAEEIHEANPPVKYFKTKPWIISPSRKVEKSFRDALRIEGLLVPKCSLNPDGATVLAICYGFRDEELTKGRIYYYSYGKSRWDVILSTPHYRKMAENLFPTDPLVDGLPATLWLECVEPSLAALISLSKLKRRKSNLSLK